MLSIKYKLIKELLPLLTKELIENVGRYEDLKLHDIAYEYNCDFNFENFCIIEYDNFNEYLEENYCITKQVGKTSKFYINSDNCCWLYSYYYACDYVNKDNTLGKKIMIINDFLDGYYYNGFNTEDNIKEFDENIINTYDNCTVSQIIKHVKDDFIRVAIDGLTDIKKCYDYIEDFKKNQVENYKNFLEE